MIRVAVSGAAGRMGRLVAEAVDGAPDLELAACYDPAGEGAVVAGREVGTSPAVVDGSDVVVEFTRPDVVMDNLAEWRRLGAHAVVGTSGFDQGRLTELRTLWGGGDGPRCLVVPNFSIGAVLMMRFAAAAAAHFAAAEVIELHHDGKVDSPSGTALATAGRIAAATASITAGDGGDTSPARGADLGGVRVHAVRLPGLVAHQEVLLGNPGETLTIRHDTTDRESFMPGVLLAVREVAALPEAVTVGLDHLIDV